MPPIIQSGGIKIDAPEFHSRGIIKGQKFPYIQNYLLFTSAYFVASQTGISFSLRSSSPLSRGRQKESPSIGKQVTTLKLTLKPRLPSILAIVKLKEKDENS